MPGVVDLLQNEDGALAFVEDAEGRLDLALVDGAEQVTQDIRSRLRMWRGEWWLDLDAGYPYDTVIATKPANATLAAQYVRDIVAATPGVTRMDSSAFSSSFAARRLTVVARAVTPWGTVGVPVISLP